MRVPREWLWVLILVIVAAFTFLTAGCIADDTDRHEVRAERAEKNAEYKYSMTYLGYPSVYLMKFEGHDYLTRGGSNSYMIHTVSCRGIHEQ